MPAASVYGPTNNGVLWAQSKYFFNKQRQLVLPQHRLDHKLSQLADPFENWHSPIDVGGIVGPSEVHCQVSPDITRISVRHYDGVCFDEDDPNQIARYGVVCDLFVNNRRIAVVLYGHLRGSRRLPVGDYFPHQFSHGGLIIGFPAPECNCYPCAVGIHVHMQIHGNNARYNRQKPFWPTERVHRGEAVYHIDY